MKKRVLAIAMAAALAAGSLIGCGSNDNDSQAPETQQPSNQETNQRTEENNAPSDPETQEASNGEWEYAGRSAKIAAPVRELEFGDWTGQGLPFYGGNVTYHLSLSAVNGPLCVEASRFAAPLLCVEMQGRRQGVIAFSPIVWRQKRWRRRRQC